MLTLACRLGEWLLRHWLGLLNACIGIYVGLAVLAPLLAALELGAPAGLIYSAYGLVCNQFPSRSFFIFGHQVAFCQRDVATYATMFLGGLAYARWRGAVSPLPWRWSLVLVAPVAIDGLTQLVGWRESTWELRVLTGMLFGVALVWTLYPLIDRGMRELEGPLR